MQTLEALKRRIKSGEDLQSVVRTMKTLSAVNIRYYEKAVGALADYNRTIEMGLYAVLHAGAGDVLARPPHIGGTIGAIVFGSDQGLCGRFNDQIVSYALEHMRELEPQPDRRLVVCVGARAYGRLDEARETVDEYFVAPGSLAAVSSMVQDMLMKMEIWRSAHHTDRIILFYNKIRSGVVYTPQLVPLLPLDREWLQRMKQQTWPTRAIPAFTMDRSRLFSSLVRHYLFVSLFRAFAESMASENASLLASMQAAERNIGDRLDEFHAQLRHQRQTAITDELLDIVSGFEALTNSKQS